MINLWYEMGRLLEFSDERREVQLKNQHIRVQL